MAEACLFCAIVAGEVPAEIVGSDDRTISFMDINPATRGHSLVIPRAHATDLMEVSEEDLEATMLAVRRLARTLETTLHPDGFNVLNSCRPVAWQTIFHFHMHLIPRYSDDPLKLPYVPTQGDPDAIAAVAAEIRGDG